MSNKIFTEKVRHPSDNTWVPMRDLYVDDESTRTEKNQTEWIKHNNFISTNTWNNVPINDYNIISNDGNSLSFSLTNSYTDNTFNTQNSAIQINSDNINVNNLFDVTLKYLGFNQTLSASNLNIIKESNNTSDDLIQYTISNTNNINNNYKIFPKDISSQNNIWKNYIVPQDGGIFGDKRNIYGFSFNNHFTDTPKIYWEKLKEEETKNTTVQIFDIKELSINNFHALGWDIFAPNTNSQRFEVSFNNNWIYFNGSPLTNQDVFMYWNNTHSYGKILFAIDVLADSKKGDLPETLTGQPCFKCYGNNSISGDGFYYFAIGKDNILYEKKDGNLFYWQECSQTPSIFSNGGYIAVDENVNYFLKRNSAWTLSHQIQTTSNDFKYSTIKDINNFSNLNIQGKMLTIIEADFVIDDPTTQTSLSDTLQDYSLATNPMYEWNGETFEVLHWIPCKVKGSADYGQLYYNYQEDKVYGSDKTTWYEIYDSTEVFLSEDIYFYENWKGFTESWSITKTNNTYRIWNDQLDFTWRFQTNGSNFYSVIQANTLSTLIFILERQCFFNCSLTGDFTFTNYEEKVTRNVSGWYVTYQTITNGLDQTDTQNISEEYNVTVNNNGTLIKTLNNGHSKTFTINYTNNNQYQINANGQTKNFSTTNGIVYPKVWILSNAPYIYETIENSPQYFILDNEIAFTDSGFNNFAKDLYTNVTINYTASFEWPYLEKTYESERKIRYYSGYNGSELLSSIKDNTILPVGLKEGAFVPLENISYDIESSSVASNGDNNRENYKLVIIKP